MPERMPTRHESIWRRSRCGTRSISAPRPITERKRSFNDMAKRWSNKRGQGRGYAWLVANLSYDGPECLIWPMARDDKGYGMCGYLGKIYKAHHLMCILKYGPKPSPKHVGSHSCGKGHMGCVHPGHVLWQTQSQNQKDRKRHGTGNIGYGRTGKLTKEQRRQILEVCLHLPIKEVAQKFGIKRGSVDYWRRKVRNAA